MRAMPSTDYRGVFEPANGDMFFPTPQTNLGLLSSARQSREELNRSKSISPSDDNGFQTNDLRDVSQSNPLDEKIDYTAAPGRRHYIAEVLKNQKISVAHCAKRLGVTEEEVLRQLDPKSNLTLNQLFDWCEVLDVPLSEILPFDSSTSDPIRNRALLLRIMKTARQIQDLSVRTKVQYAAETLILQLLELVPDFAMIEAWPSVGQSRVAMVDGLSTRRVDSETSKLIENS